MRRLRIRSLGRKYYARTVRQAIRGYVLEHVLLNLLYRMGSCDIEYREFDRNGLPGGHRQNPRAASIWRMRHCVLPDARIENVLAGVAEGAMGQRSVFERIGLPSNRRWQVHAPAIWQSRRKLLAVWQAAAKAS